MRHSTPTFTANAYTDPKLFDVAGARDALPSLPLDRGRNTESERERGVENGNCGNGSVALPVALPDDKSSEKLVTADKTADEPPEAVESGGLDVSTESVKERTPVTSPAQSRAEWRRPGSNRQPLGCKPGGRTTRKVFPHNGLDAFCCPWSVSRVSPDFPCFLRVCRRFGAAALKLMRCPEFDKPALASHSLV